LIKDLYTEKKEQNDEEDDDAEEEKTTDVIIPKGIISREKNAHLNKTEEEFEQSLLKRFMFISEDMFRMLSV
jgi:hypothetical protein